MITIIIPELNEEEGIGACPGFLLDRTVDRDPYGIIVVDGGSDDRTRESAGRYADHVISQKRSGIGGARGDGAEASHGDILVYIDAHTLYRRDWLEWYGRAWPARAIPSAPGRSLSTMGPIIRALSGSGEHINDSPPGRLIPADRLQRGNEERCV